MHLVSSYNSCFCVGEDLLHRAMQQGVSHDNQLLGSLITFHLCLCATLTRIAQLAVKITPRYDCDRRCSKLSECRSCSN